MGLRKPTQMVRRTVTETGRQSYEPREGEPLSKRRELGPVIVGPESDCGLRDIRRVTVILPETPAASVVVGPQVGLGDGTDIAGIDDSGATPADIANGRNYQWPEPDAGREYVFELLPEQFIAAISTDGVCKLTVIVEYLEP